MSDATQTPPKLGTFCWNETLTRDPAASKAFYTQLFGWTCEEMDMGPGGTYTMFKAGDTMAGGMMEIGGEKFEGVPTHWLSYITVDDVDASTAKAESLGAKVCAPPTDIPNIGRFSVVIDPVGAAIGLFQGA